MTDIEDLLAPPYTRLPLVHDDTDRLPDATMRAIREDVVAGTELPTFLAAEAADESSPFRAELNATFAQLPAMEVNALTGEWNVSGSGAVGDGVTDCTTQLRAMVAAIVEEGRGTLFFPAGVWVTDTLEIPANVAVRLAREATVRLKPHASGLNGGRAVFVITGSGSSVEGGLIDGNRAGQDIAAYNAAGGSSAVPCGGLIVAGSIGSPIRDIVVQTTITGAVDFGYRATGMADSHVDVDVTDSGAGATLNACSNISGPGFRFTNINNGIAKTYPHVFDLLACTNVRLQEVVSTGHGGTATIAAGTSFSDWISGATITGSTDIEIKTLRMSTVTSTAQTKGVGVSLLSDKGIKIGSLIVAGYSDCLFEVAGLVNSEITNIDLDGRWQVSDVLAGAGVGWKIANYGYYPDFTSRSQRFTEFNVFTNILVRRCSGVGLFNTGGRRNTFVGGRITGCRFGVRSQFIATSSNENFTAQMPRDPEGNRFVAIDCSYNEEHGWDIRDGAFTLLEACRGANNGQASTYGAARLGGTYATTPSGMYFGTTPNAGLSKTGIVLLGPELTDTQAFTDALSAAAAGVATLSARDPERYVPGQTIKLVGAGPSGADLVTRVVDTSFDEVVVQDAPSTVPTVALTGTIATVGTAVTGVGTSFTAELNARYWIRAGGQVRQVIKVADDTHATLSAPFPTNLAAGTTAEILKTTVAGMPSQMFGGYFSADTLAPIMIGGAIAGNTSQPVSDNTPSGASKFRAINVPGVAGGVYNTFSSASYFVAFSDAGSAGRSVIGTVGPSNQGGVGAGATGTGSGADVALYRRAAGVWRSDNVLELGSQSSAPGTPTSGAVLYVESGSLKVKGSSGTVTVLGPA